MAHWPSEHLLQVELLLLALVHRLAQQRPLLQRVTTARLQLRLQRVDLLTLRAHRVTCFLQLRPQRLHLEYDTQRRHTYWVIVDLAIR